MTTTTPKPATEPSRRVLNPDEIHVSPLWELVTNTDCVRIRRSFVARNFQAALDALQAMGEIAEAMNHHPDLHLTEYRTVTIEVYTHTVRGVTQKDVALAQKLDEVPIDYSPHWKKEHGLVDS